MRLQWVLCNFLPVVLGSRFSLTLKPTNWEFQGSEEQANRPRHDRRSGFDLVFCSGAPGQIPSKTPLRSCSQCVEDFGTPCRKLHGFEVAPVSFASDFRCIAVCRGSFGKCQRPAPPGAKCLSAGLRAIRFSSKARGLNKTFSGVASPDLDTLERRKSRKRGFSDRRSFVCCQSG